MCLLEEPCDAGDGARSAAQAGIAPGYQREVRIVRQHLRRSYATDHHQLRLRCWHQRPTKSLFSAASMTRTGKRCDHFAAYPLNGFRQFVEVQLISKELTVAQQVPRDRVQIAPTEPISRTASCIAVNSSLAKGTARSSRWRSCAITQPWAD